MKNIGDIIKLYRQKKFPGHGGQKQAADALGIGKAGWNHYEKAERLSRSTLAKIAKVLDVSVDDLVFQSSDRDDQPIEILPSSTRTRPPYSIPVVGLAACDVQGWYSPQPLALRAPLPVEYEHPENLFAVIAVGQSMIPDGIREGFLLFCDESATPVAGDAVYVKTTDGKATIKRFVKMDVDWLTLQGWLDQDKNGVQKIFTSKFARNTIQLIACVMMVKRKA